MQRLAKVEFLRYKAWRVAELQVELGIDTKEESYCCCIHNAAVVPSMVRNTGCCILAYMAIVPSIGKVYDRCSPSLGELEWGCTRLEMFGVDNMCLSMAWVRVRGLKPLLTLCQRTRAANSVVST